MQIDISENIKAVCPQLELVILTAEVVNSPTSDALWAEMNEAIRQISATFSIDEINKRPQVLATRKVYKMLGKDPNRYRPSAEALCRRIVRGIDIYRVSTLVDVVNLVSIRSGISIGGFDMNKIEGELIRLTVGMADDEFDAIGRGKLNVEGLPLYRDNIGGIGTPTSDNERTKISEETTRILLIFNGYNGVDGLESAVNHTLLLLQKYAELQNAKLEYIR